MLCFPRPVWLLGLLLSALTVFAAEPPPASAFVQVRGRDFITPAGEVFRMRGTNFGNWLLPEGYMWGFHNAGSPRLIENAVAELVGDVSAAKFWRQWRDNYVTRDDVRFLRAAGFNTVRLPLNWRLFVTEHAPFRFEGPGWALLDRVIGWCREEGLYTIIDLHGAPGGQTGANIDDSRARPLLFEDPAAQQLTIDLWRALAARYRAETTVLGYDLLNEPIADYHNPKKYNPLLAEFYRRLVPAVREVDPHHIIFLGGAQWNTQFEVLGPPFAPNLAYTFHLYQDAPVEKSIQRYLAWREKTNVPLWLGESGEESDDWVEKFRLVLEKHDIGWCFWTYKKIGAGETVATAPAPADWKTIVKYVNTPRGEDFDAIRKALPPLETGRRALAELLENIRFEHCHINAGYVRALGLNPAPAAPAAPVAR
ncbi:MAG: cellulase family glycosylhydrolase [Opitutae bacterium]|nr:cellulase family glycosylhydrolase [Opitutae bacterium]